MRLLTVCLLSIMSLSGYAFAVTSLSPLQVTPADAILGSEKAPVTVIEYASLSCSHCATFHNKVLPVLEEKYIKPGKVKFISRPFPLNAPALRAAQLASCSGKERYHSFLKALFSTQDKWAFEPNYMSKLAQIAKIGGIDDAGFKRCMADKRVEENILKTYKAAADTLHIEATPTFFIDGQKLAGAASAETFSAALDKALAAKTPRR